MPLVAGWLSDRVGRKPLIIGVYLGGAVGFVVFLLAGSIDRLACGSASCSWACSRSPRARSSRRCWPTSRRRRSATPSYALYFTLAFGVGSLWVAVYGVRHRARSARRPGVPVVFGLMAVAFVLAALGDPADPGRRARGRQRRVRGRPARGVTPRHGPRDGRPGRCLLSSAGPVQRAPSVGAWRSLVARIVRDDEVGGSNPLAPTIPTSSSSCGSDIGPREAPSTATDRRSPSSLAAMPSTDLAADDVPTKLSVTDPLATDETRIDRWLCAVRLVKTRPLATRLCEGGHVLVNGSPAKPSTKVRAGDRVEALIADRERIVEVVRPIESRVGAAVAATCYVDHSPPVVPEAGPAIMPRTWGGPAEQAPAARVRAPAQGRRRLSPRWSMR